MSGGWSIRIVVMVDTEAVEVVDLRPVVVYPSLSKLILYLLRRARANMKMSRGHSFTRVVISSSPSLQLSSSPAPQLSSSPALQIYQHSVKIGSKIVHVQSHLYRSSGYTAHGLVSYKTRSTMPAMSRCILYCSTTLSRAQLLRSSRAIIDIRS